MNQLYFKTNYNFNKIIKTIRRIYYGEERTYGQRIQLHYSE